MKINPISVNNLKFYDWFHSEDHNTWYYYKDRKKGTYNSAELSDTVDPNIDPIIKFLNGNGFKTLPSCEGHNRSKDFCDKAWKNLNNDLKKIRTTGLFLKNCENENRYFLYDPNWEIPFSYSEFKKICSGEKEVTGYVAFYCSDKKIFTRLSDSFSNSEISLKHDGKAIEIFNKCLDDKKRADNWKEIYKVLRRILE